MTEASFDIRKTDPGLFVLVALLGFRGICGQLVRYCNQAWCGVTSCGWGP